MVKRRPQIISRKAMVDKKRLYKAVQLIDNKERSYNFACSKQLLLDEFPSNVIRVEGLGIIKLPVSLEDAARLKQISQEAPYGKGKNTYFDPSIIRALQIDSSKVLEPSNLDLSSFIVQELGLETKFVNIQAKLEKLVLYETDGHYKQDLNSENDFVKFGVAIIQLPVEGGHDGGRFNIQHKGRKKTFENNQDSNKQMYLTAFYGDCEHVMEHVTRGCKMVLVFNLFWMNAISPVMPQDLVTFQMAMKKMEKALKPWSPPTNGDLDIADHQYVPDVVSDILSTKSSDEENEIPYYKDIIYSLSASKEDILFFVLQKKYDANTFKFDLLRGKDRNLARLLQTCPFIEVQLAIVTTMGENIKTHSGDKIYGRSCPKKELLSTEISRWMDSSDVSRSLTMGLDWHEQRVGPIRNLLSTKGVPDKVEQEDLDSDYDDDCFELIEDYLSQESDGESDEGEHESFDNEKKHFYNYILVIWPKHQTFQMYCRYGIQSLLDNMEKKLSSASFMQMKMVRQEVKEEFQKIVSFCCSEPRKAWGEEWEENDKNKAKLTERLLRLCVVLQAREEGLGLLKILGSDFEGNHRYETVRFEGVQNELVAKAIAEFEYKVTGWADCADLIKRLVSPRRLIEQLNPILKLAQYFMDANCMEGAKVVGDCIASSLVQIDESQLKRWELIDVLAYVDLIVLLEELPQTSNRKRLASFVKFFSNLHPLLQCRLVLHLDGQNSSRFKGIDSCQFLFPDLCSALLDCDFHLKESSYFQAPLPLIKDLVIDLFKCYASLGNGEWLQSFMKNICTVPSSSSRQSKASKNELLKILFSSSVTWEIIAKAEQDHSAAYMKWRRDTCRLFVRQHFLPSVNTSGDLAMKIILCLLCVNDDVSWQLFAETLCQSFRLVESNIFIEIFLQNIDIQQAIVDSSYAFPAFLRIVNFWIEQSKSLVEPPFSWCQPEANLPEHEKVESFLRSSTESMRYNVFVSYAQAKEFALKLENKASTNGFSVRVRFTCRSSGVGCKISKNQSYQEEIVGSVVTRKSQVPQLVQLRERLNQKRANIRMA